jgi:hypothetical protein
MISDGTFRRWGHWPYFQITDKNSEFLSRISREIMKAFWWIGVLSGKNISCKLVECNISVGSKPQLLYLFMRENIDDFFYDAETVKSFRFRTFWLK